MYLFLLSCNNKTFISLQHYVLSTTVPRQEGTNTTRKVQISGFHINDYEDDSNVTS
jgi:hypothetical protein